MLTRKCDICGYPAVVDTKTIYGHWAYLCEKCNERYGIKEWNTLLAKLSENGIPIQQNYEWNENVPYYNQAIYKDMRKALDQYTIEITMKDNKTKLVTEGNIPLLRCIMNIAVHEKNYPVTWKVFEL